MIVTRVRTIKGALTYVGGERHVMAGTGVEGGGGAADGGGGLRVPRGLGGAVGGAAPAAAGLAL